MYKESVEVNFPFEFCKKCTQVRVNMETLYADDKPVVVQYAYCANHNICENVMALANENSEEEESDEKEVMWEKQFYKSEDDACFLAKCSHCGYTEHVFACWYVENHWKYCPNCGAQMKWDNS